ncbi:MAG TPA: polysaccharide biosynthesis C-terminal domain-containing protein [Pyrinomonadaceae bacterium]|nr:polysaccharide biosynthesis C-terminal domain-containing protein [Pyrinomonadaceae bacterium]
MQAEIDLTLPERGESLRTTSSSVLDRISKGLGGLSLNAAVNFISQITIVPVALYAWGKIRYGEWIVLTGLVTFLRITDLGLQTVVVNRLCASFACGDQDQMQRELHNALRVQVPLVLAVGLLSTGLLTVIPIGRFFELQTVSQTTIIAVASILIFELLIGIPMGVITSIYRATGRLARGSVLIACQQAAVLILTLSLIAINSGFVGLAIVRLGLAVMAALWIIYDLRRLYPWLSLWAGGGDWREGLSMLGPGLLFMLMPLADYLSIQFTLMVVQGAHDGGAVSRLATHRTVVNLAMMGSTLLMSAVWPEFTTLHARSESEKLIKLHRTLARMNTWLVGALAFGMLPFVALIYPLWTAGRLSIDKWTLAFLILRMLVWGTWSASMILLCSINKHKFVALSLIGSAILTGGLSVVLVPRMGISGAALAQLCGDVCVSAWVIPLLAAKEIKDSAWQFFSKSIRALVIGIIVPVGIGLIGWRLVPPGLFRLVFLLPLIAALGAVLVWRELTPSEKRISKQFLSGALRTVVLDGK